MHVFALKRLSASITPPPPPIIMSLLWILRLLSTMWEQIHVKNHNMPTLSKYKYSQNDKYLILESPYPRLLCARFGQNWSRIWKVFNLFELNCYPWKRAFICANFLHSRMHQVYLKLVQLELEKIFRYLYHCKKGFVLHLNKNK